MHTFYANVVSTYSRRVCYSRRETEATLKYVVCSASSRVRTAIHKTAGENEIRENEIRRVHRGRSVRSPFLVHLSPPSPTVYPHPPISSLPNLINLDNKCTRLVNNTSGLARARQRDKSAAINVPPISNMARIFVRDAPADTPRRSARPRSIDRPGSLRFLR